ncbi:MAG: YlbF family regulator [Bacillus sp. (in: firmicutes)]
MSRNVYDLAYALENGIKESKDYQDLKAAYEAVHKDEIANRMFENFRDLQMRLQQKQMAGEQILPEEMEQAQKTFQLVQQNPTIGALMQAEQKMSTIISELSQIITKPLAELYGAPQQ